MLENLGLRHWKLAKITNYIHSTLFSVCTVVCFKCRKSGHMSSGCRNPITCTVCFRQGHSFKSCPAVREIGDITIGTKWTKPVVEQRQEGSDPNLENI